MLSITRFSLSIVFFELFNGTDRVENANQPIQIKMPVTSTVNKIRIYAQE